MIKIGGCFSCNVRNRPFSQNQGELKICSPSIFLLSKRQVIMVQCGWYKTAIYCIWWAGQKIKVKKCSLSVMSVTVELPIYKMKIYSCYQDFFVCTKSSGWPWGWQLPELWAMQNLLMLHPQDWKPTVAQGVHGSTWNWLMHSYQTKRPWKTVENKRFHCHRLSANSQKCNFVHSH